MITRTAAFQTSDEQTHVSLEAAQKHELGLLLKSCGDCIAHVSVLVAHAETVIDILSTTPTSKTRARKANGGSKKRVKTTVQAAGITSPKAAAQNRLLQDGQQ